MDRLFDVFYTTADGKEQVVRYCCKDKSEARRLFFSEIKRDEELKRVAEVKGDFSHRK